MKPLYEIRNTQEIDRLRSQLLQQLHREERVLNRDAERLQKRWKRWTSIGTGISNVVTSVSSKFSLFSIGFSLARRLLRKCK